MLIHPTGRKASLRAAVILLALILVLPLALGLLQRDVQAESAVKDAWNNMQQVGAYEFSSTVEQVTYPAPRLSNVGRTADRTVYQVTGKTDLPNERMQLSLYQNEGSLLNGRDGIEIRVEQGQAFGRAIGYDWNELQDFSADSFAPGSDAASFLQAAIDVRALGETQLTVTRQGITQPVSVQHYRFSLDANRFADYMRQQLIKELQRGGKLPNGMNLNVSDALRRMTGTGEVWIDGDGLPVRLKLSMRFPPESSGERLEAQLDTTFFNHDRRYLLAQQPPLLRLIGMIGLPTHPDRLLDALLPLQLGALLALLTVLMVANSQRRWVFRLVGAVVIASMLVTPLWQGAQAKDFEDYVATETARQNERQATAKAQREANASFNDSTWNPNLSLAQQAAAEKAGWLADGSPDSAAGRTPYSLPALAGPAAPLAADGVDEAAVADSDGDGLSDSMEAEFNLTTLDPNDADTDDDGLSDGEEFNLALRPGYQDSDGDGILDYNEIISFYYADKDWYTNPMARDTDKDGQMDGAECFARVSQDTSFVPGVCGDTDSDDIPDVFDTDDDGDGVPTSVDESPYAYSTEEFGQTRPFKLNVANLNSNLPVFFTYQLRPTNPVHLTYSMNVLDWPTGDTDGQIMRVSDDTFADQLTPEKAANDPKADNGDLRLIPMSEVRLTGTSLPLPVTTTLKTAISTTVFSGNVIFTGQPGSNPASTLVRLEGGPAGTYALHTAVGTCVTMESPLKIGDLTAGGASASVALPLAAFAGGQRTLFITNPAGTEVLTCHDVAPTAHGELQHQVIDTNLLTAYGVSARNDVNGDVLLYAPLSLVSGVGGSAPVAFQSKIPFTAANSGFSDSQQEVRMIWVLNMLTDQCTAQPDDWDAEADGDWCDASKLERWVTNQPYPIHTYPDAFSVTGLSMVEEHGIDMAVAFENPLTDTDPRYDDPLWGLSQGLEASFASGRDDNSDNIRDVTVAEIQQRFDPDFNAAIAANDPSLWGLPKDGFQVERYQYAFNDGVHDFMQNKVKTLFDSYFNTLPEAQRPEYANLLFARESTFRMVTYGEPAAACSGDSCVFDFDGQDVLTQAVLNWAPYQRTGEDWNSYSLQDYLDVLEANLRDLDAYRPDDDSDEKRYIIEGQIFMARFYYEGLYRGYAMLVALNGIPVINEINVLEDSFIFDRYYTNNAKGQIVTKVVSAVTDAFYLGLESAPALMLVLSAGTRSLKAQGFLLAVGMGLYTKLNNLSTMLGKILTVVVGVVAIIAVLAAVTGMILYLAVGDSLAGKIGGRVAFAIIGVVSVITSIATLADAIAALKAATALSKAAQAAAIVGAVIGFVVAWGVFAFTWASTGVSFGSLEFNNFLADAIATSITVVLFAVLSATVVGAIIVAIIGLIDGLIAIICAATGAHELEESHWARQYVCIGISGWITKIIKWTIYSQTYMVNYSSGDRMAFGGLSTSLASTAAGMTVGNPLSVTLQLTNTIILSDIPIDWKAAAYWWQYSGDTAKTSTFNYLVQTSETDIHENLERSTMSSQWESAGEDQWEQLFSPSTGGYTIVMPEAGINRDPAAYMSEGSAIPVQECWAVPVPVPPIWILVPVCYIRTAKASIHNSIGEILTLDVLPPTLDEFYTLTEVETNGYSLAWGRDADIVFPIIKDIDGDGLLASLHGGDDPNDSLYDTDGDGLSDYFELAQGSNPELIDTDDDGLLDADEINLGTSITRKDTDGDGLPDKEEVDGWLFTWAFESDGTPRETMVYPDPLTPDTDFDGVTDLLEKVYGFNPNAPSQANILDYSLVAYEMDAPVMMLRFEEAGGAVLFADSSNFGNNAICEPAECPASGVEGRYGSAASFTGSDSLSLPTSAKSLVFAQDRPFTLAGWVYWNGGAGTLVSKWSEAANYTQEMRFELSAGGVPSLRGNAITVNATQSIPSATWTHVAVSVGSGQASFFINGQAAGNSAWSNAPSYPVGSIDSPLMVGAYGGAAAPSGYFNGKLDEWAVFAHAVPGADLQTRMMSARYNFNDEFVRPGEYLVYQSTVENLLNSRFAYGLLTTGFSPTSAIVDFAAKLLPKTFVLWPDNPVATGINTAIISDTLQIDPAFPASGDLTITQTAAAQIVDRRSESNLAELWLKLNEAAGASEFEDSSGNMPPRNVTCTTCPTSGEAGILNNAVKFTAGQDTPVPLPDLERMRLLDRGYTVAMWVKPSASAAASPFISLIRSSDNRFELNIRKDGSGSYVPQVYMNGSDVTTSLTLWRTILPDVWSHLALRYSSSDQKLDIYVNGARVTSLTGLVPLSANTNLTLGGAPQDVTTWVDDVRIFSRPLTTVDINRLAERPVLKMAMDDVINWTDSSVYNQSVSHGSGVHSNMQTTTHLGESIRGRALAPGTGAGVSYLKVNGNSLLNMQDGAFSFAVWIWPRQFLNGTDWEGVFGRDSGDNTAYPTLERKGLKLRFGFGDGTTWQVDESNDVLAFDQWNHVVVTYQPSPTQPGKYEYKLFVNSRAMDSRLFDSAPASNSTFFIGHSSTRFSSTVDSVTVNSHDDAGDVAEIWMTRYVNDVKQNCFYPSSDCDEEKDIDGGNSYTINYSTAYNGYDIIRYDVDEDDWGANPNDFCGSLYHRWYELPGQKSAPMTNGFEGTLYATLTRPSVQFGGFIDELEVYRYALDSEQVFDQYNAIPITARLPLDERPSADTFENRAFVGTQDDGVCTAPGCPAAGTVGLINQAARFDGGEDVIAVPVDTTSNYMVSLWANTTCQNCGVYSLSQTNTLIHEIYLKNGNFCALTGSTELCSTGGGYANDQWHHVVYTNDGALANLWVDGAIVNAVNGGSGIAAAPTGQAKLGYAPNATAPYFNGQLDDVRVYRYTQAAEVVAQLEKRAPLLLAHLDESDAAAGLQDSGPGDWVLACSGAACPQMSVEGRLATSAEFDGQDDKVALTQTQFSPDAPEFSAGIWVWPTRVFNAPQTLWTLNKPDNSGLRYSLALAPDGTNLCVLTADSAGTCAAQSNVGLIQNNWNFVMLSVERLSPSSEVASLYINGYLDSTYNVTPLDGMGRLTVGASAGFGGVAGGAFAGRLDEITLYEYAQNEIDVRDTFHYQMSQVEEHATLRLKIDVEAPQVALTSFSAGFPYAPQLAQVMHVEATDVTSGIGLVEMLLEHRNAPGVISSMVPLCLDSDAKTSFCPTFDPSLGDGRYTLRFRAIDKVGHEVTSPDYELLVDGGAPRILSDQSDGVLLPAEMHPARRQTWLLKLNGKVEDETLGDNNAGSGINPETILVTILNQKGEPVGAGTQAPQLTPISGGYDWAIDYLLPEREPTGKLRVVIDAADRAGNPGRLEFWVFLDATPVIGSLNQNNLPQPVGRQLLFAPASALADNRLAEIGPLAATVALTNPILITGTLTGQASDIPSDLPPHMSPDGKQAVSGVAQVDYALKQETDAPFLFSQPYPDGLLAWLPLDGEKQPVDGNGDPDLNSDLRLFLDISPYQIAGTCVMPDCPQGGVPGHARGSAYFAGDLQVIDLGQQVNLANKSFTISVWAKRDAINDNDPMLWQGPVSISNQRFLFGVNAENRLVCGFGGSDLLSPLAYPDTGWHHWACAYDSATGTRTLFRDGQALASDSAAPLAVMQENLFIGLAPVGAFNGYLDELIVLEQALTTEQLRAQYTGYNTVFNLAVDENFYAGGDGLPDASGYFHTATLITGAGDDLNKVIAGQVGPFALQLDGGDRLSVPPAYSLRLERGAFTQSAWIHPTLAQEQDIFSQRDENPEQRYPSLILTADNRLQVGFGNGFNWFSAQTEPGVVTLNTWNFVAASFDGFAYRVYVNGLLVFSSDALSGLLPYPAEQFSLGDGFSGGLDDARIYPRALSGLEIKALMGSGWQTAGLQGSGNTVDWNGPLASGLEGPYHIDVRGWDQQGHYSAQEQVENQWGGVVDTLAPRLTFQRIPAVVPEGTTVVSYTFSIEDTMLDEASVYLNMCDTPVTLQREYNNSAWYLSRGVPPNTSLFRLTGSCAGDVQKPYAVGVFACDLGGNCASETLSYYSNLLYLPLMTMQEVGPRPAPAPQAARPAVRPEAGVSLRQATINPGADQSAPVLSITSQTIGQADVRLLMNILLHGQVSDDSGIAWVRFRLLQDGRVVAAGDASVFGTRWNGLWTFLPGAPLDGNYTLEVTAADWADNRTTTSQSISVQLGR